MTTQEILELYKNKLDEQLKPILESDAGIVSWRLCAKPKLKRGY